MGIFARMHFDRNHESQRLYNIKIQNKIKHCGNLSAIFGTNSHRLHFRQQINNEVQCTIHMLIVKKNGGNSTALSNLLKGKLN